MKILFLFAGHALCSVTLILLNKSIATSFSYTWTLVGLQNMGTLLGAVALHLTGIQRIGWPKKEHVWRIVGGSMWLIAVLWASIRALELVSVPLYVVARNTVPFQTALLDRIFLRKQISGRTYMGLFLTILGCALYTFEEHKAFLSGDAGTANGQYTVGLFFAALNTVLVAGICVYESAMMRMVKAYLSPIELNFFRVLFSMPFLLPLLVYEWWPQGGLSWLLSGSSGTQYCCAYSNACGPSAWAVFSEAVTPVWPLILLTAVFAFSIGNFLLALQTVTSATTIQLTNLSYKLVTTLTSRFTHPSAVTELGWVGYGVCSLGMFVYLLAPVRDAKSDDEKEKSGAAKKTDDEAGGRAVPGSRREDLTGLGGSQVLGSDRGSGNNAAGKEREVEMRRRGKQGEGGG